MDRISLPPAATRSGPHRPRRSPSPTCTAGALEYVKDRDDSVFAIATRVRLAQNKYRGNVEQRHKAKLALSRELFRRGLGRERVTALVLLLDFIMRLPEKREVRYTEELMAYERELNMAHVATIESLAEKRGRNEGRVEGQLQSRREDVIEALEIRFGECPYELREAIGRVDSESELKRLHALAITAETIDDFSV